MHTKTAQLQTLKIALAKERFSRQMSCAVGDRRNIKGDAKSLKQRIYVNTQDSYFVQCVSPTYFM